MPAHKVIRVVLLGWWLINKLLYFFRIISQTGIGPAKKDKVSTLIKIWKLSFHIPFQNNVNPELKINLGLLLACVASGSARVRRENWNESKKRNEGGGGLTLTLSLPFFFCSRSKFRAITRLETLATQARLLPNVITGQENFSSVTTSVTSKQKHEVKKDTCSLET